MGPAPTIGWTTWPWPLPSVMLKNLKKSPKPRVRLWKEGFHARRQRFDDSGQPIRVDEHRANDFVGPRGTPVVSPITGSVFHSGWVELGGWTCTIQARASDGSGDKVLIYFAHLLCPSPLSKGDAVDPFTLLGLMGDTGGGPVGTRKAQPPHTHVRQTEFTRAAPRGIIVDMYPEALRLCGAKDGAINFNLDLKGDKAAVLASLAAQLAQEHGFELTPPLR